MKIAKDRLIHKLWRSLIGHAPSIDEKPFCEQQPQSASKHSRGGEDVKNRVLIITQPKAGTYMIAEILRQAGLHHTYLHLGAHRLQAYDSFFLRDGLFNPRKFDVACGIEESRKLVRCGELAVSHLPFSTDLAEKLSGFKIIHIKRELRSAFISWCRMLLYSEKFGPQVSDLIRTENIAGFMRSRGKNRIRNALFINAWSRSENVLSLKMECVISDPGKSIDAMLKHVDCKPSMSATEIWERTGREETLTNSAKHPELKWTAGDEEVFREIGGPDANRRMGYEE